MHIDDNTILYGIGALCTALLKMLHMIMAGAKECREQYRKLQDAVLKLHEHSCKRMPCERREPYDLFEEDRRILPDRRMRKQKFSFDERRKHARREDDRGE